MIELRELKMALCLPECVFPVALLHGKLSWAAQGNGNTTSLQSTTWVTEKLPLTQESKVLTQALLCVPAHHHPLHLHAQVRRGVLQ